MNSNNDIVWIRSALFVPGNRPDRVDKALKTAADVIIIDLEDAVPLSEKANARRIVRQKIETSANRRIMVRINALDTEFAQADLNAVITRGLAGIMVPKIETASQIPKINARLSECEKQAGMASGSVFILPLIESARGIENAFRIASEKTNPNRMLTLAFGAADYTLDLGNTITRSGEELIYPRSRLAVACRAAGLAPPVDTPFMIDLKDKEALIADTTRAVQLGFQGKLCIHPNQVEICNDLFSPSKVEIEHARKVIKAFENAEARGSGAIQLDGVFIDNPVVERAFRIVKMADLLS